MYQSYRDRELGVADSHSLHSEPVLPCSISLSRRKLLGMVMGAGATFITNGQTASAFFFKKSADTSLDLESLPARWLEMQGRNLAHYQDYLAGLKLEQITVQQVIDAHAKQRGGVWNQLPPSTMWKNIAHTLRATDRIARKLGLPVKEIVSAYRAPAYNARCAGAHRSSWHKSNFALDVTFAVSATTVTRMAREMRNKGLFRGGVGSYGAFTHIDCRGTNVDW